MGEIVKQVEYENGCIVTLSFEICTTSDRMYPLLVCPLCHGVLENNKECPTQKIQGGHYYGYRIIKDEEIENEILEALEIGLKNAPAYAFRDEEMVERIKKYKERYANFRFKCLKPLTP